MSREILVQDNKKAADTNLTTSDLKPNNKYCTYHSVRLTELHVPLVHQGQIKVLHGLLSACLSDGRQSLSFKLSPDLSTHSVLRNCLPPLQLFEHWNQNINLYSSTRFTLLCRWFSNLGSFSNFSFSFST